MDPQETEEETDQAATLREARWAEIDRLLLIGLSPKQIAEELRLTQAAISRQAYKHGNKRFGRLFDTKVQRRRFR